MDLDLDLHSLTTWIVKRMLIVSEVTLPQQAWMDWSMVDRGDWESELSVAVARSWRGSQADDVGFGVDRLAEIVGYRRRVGD